MLSSAEKKALTSLYLASKDLLDAAGQPYKSAVDVDKEKVTIPRDVFMAFAKKHEELLQAPGFAK